MASMFTSAPLIYKLLKIAPCKEVRNVFPLYLQDGQTAWCIANKNGHTKIADLLHKAKVGRGLTSSFCQMLTV